MPFQRRDQAVSVGPLKVTKIPLKEYNKCKKTWEKGGLYEYFLLKIVLLGSFRGVLVNLRGPTDLAWSSF